MQACARFQVIVWWCSVVAVTWSVPVDDTLDTLRMRDKINGDHSWLWSSRNFPHPRSDPVNCRRPRPSFVCDPDQVLHPEEADKLDFIIERIRNETECVCAKCLENRPEGATIGVAIMKRIYIPYNTVKQKEISKFAQDLRAKWRMGACDNDIVICISTMDKLMATSVGSMLTNTMDMADASDRIEHETRGHFTTEQYYVGLESMIQSYFDVVRRQQNMLARAANRQDTSESNVGLIVGLVVGGLVLIVVVAVVGLFLFRRKRWSDKFEFDSEKSEWGRGKPVKTGQQHSDAVYAPCSIEEPDALQKGVEVTSDEGETEDTEKLEDREDHTQETAETEPSEPMQANGTPAASTIPATDVHNTSEA